MDCINGTNETVKVAAKATVLGAISFGLGYLGGKIFKIDALKYGIASAVSTVAVVILDSVVDVVKEKQGLPKSKVTMIKASGAAVIATATAVSLFALGVLGPVGLGIMLGIAALCFGIQVGAAAYQKRQENQAAHPLLA